MRRFLFHLVLTLRTLLRPTAFGVAGVIYDDQGRVLLVRQTYMPGWRLPGGAIGHGEPAETALRRELAEEVGLSGGRVRLFGIYSRKVWWISHVVALYAVENGGTNFRPNIEVSAVMWASPQTPPANTAPATLRRLRELAMGAQQDAIW